MASFPGQVAGAAGAAGAPQQQPDPRMTLNAAQQRSQQAHVIDHAKQRAHHAQAARTHARIAAIRAQQQAAEAAALAATQRASALLPRMQQAGQGAQQGGGGGGGEKHGRHEEANAADAGTKKRCR